MSSRFELIEEEVVEEPSEKSKKVAEGLKFFGFQPKAETIEKIRKPLVQKLVVPATSFVSDALGSFGDIGSLINEFIARPLSEKITGKPSVPFEETPIGALLPTSERLRTGIEEFAGEKLRPETTGEKVLDVGAGFLGSLFAFGKGKFLGAGKVPFSQKDLPAFARNVIGAFAPAAVAVGTEAADLPPWAQASATIATSLLANRITGKSLKTINNEAFTLRDKLAKKVILPSGELEKRLDTLTSQMAKGGPTPPKSAINNFIQSIRGKTSAGHIPLEELIELRKDVFENSKQFTRSQIKGSQRFWRGLGSAIDNSIGDFEKLNPKFKTANRFANSLFRGRKEANIIEEFIGRNKLLSTVAGGAGGIVLKTLGSAAGVGTGKILGAAKAALVTKAMVSNPGLRKAWKDILINATKEEVRGTAKAIKKFNTLIEREEKKESKPESRFQLIE